MIIVLKPSVSEDEIKHVVEKIEKIGLKAHISKGVERTIIGVIGDERIMNKEQFEAISCVEKVMPVLKPYKLASREFHPDLTMVRVDDVIIGGNEIVVMAGPCAVESEEQIIGIAKAVKKAGAKVLRGGAFKPRTSPYSFQGLGEEGLKLLAKAKDETGLPIVTEVLDAGDVELVSRYADILQIGARNVQNYRLLKRVGKIKKPVLLKRGFASTLKEFLMCAEYIMLEGNHQVILCERGIRTFCSYTRNTLDLNIVPVIKKVSHLPIVVDPSQGTGNYELVPAMSKAAIAAGADGLLIEVHPNPEEAVSDGDQSLLPEKFEHMMTELKLIAKAVGRSL